MDPVKLKEIIRIANEAVADLDGDLKKIAFQTTLDKLLAENTKPKSNNLNKKTKSRKNPKSNSVRENAPVDSSLKEIIININRTKYNKIAELKNTLDKSLYLLLVIRDDLKIDGLNPAQIATILQEVFRIKATKNAVSMALGQDAKYTDRVLTTINGGKGYVYKIMLEGEKYVNSLIS